MCRKRLVAFGIATLLFVAAADRACSQESSKDVFRKAISASKRAVKEKKYEQTGQVGGHQSNFTELYNTGAVLIGFELGIGHFFPPKEVVKSVRPIYLSPGGETYGKWHGQAGSKTTGKRLVKSSVHRTVKVKAKPGYAVSGIRAKTGLLLDGMSVGFMRLTPRGLDAADAYESDWIGTGDDKIPALAGYTGDLVIGVIGEENDKECVGLGLIVINEAMADLVDPALVDPASGSPPKEGEKGEAKPAAANGGK